MVNGKKKELILKKSRNEYDIVKMMLMRIWHHNLINTIDVLDYLDRIQIDFKNEVIKIQVMMRIKDLFDRYGFKLKLV